MRLRFKNKGVQAVLDAVIDFLPAPDEVKAIEGVIPNNSDEVEEEADTSTSSDEEPFSALAFKIATDPFVGTLTFIRVYSGVLSVGDGVMNTTKSKKERVGRMVQMHSNNREEIKEGLRIRSLANEVILALCGSALKIKVFKPSLMQ